MQARLRKSGGALILIQISERKSAKEYEEALVGPGRSGVGGHGGWRSRLSQGIASGGRPNGDRTFCGLFRNQTIFRNYPFGHTLAARRVVLVRVLVVGLGSPAVAPSAPARLFCCFCTMCITTKTLRDFYVFLWVRSIPYIIHPCNHITPNPRPKGQSKLKTQSPLTYD